LAREREDIQISVREKLRGTGNRGSELRSSAKGGFIIREKTRSCPTAKRELDFSKSQVQQIKSFSVQILKERKKCLQKPKGPFLFTKKRERESQKKW